MKTKSLFIMILGFFVLCIAGPAHSWQGRMAGMGDPYGLIQDESDFLIHPAGIANGKGMNFYGDFRYTWNEVNKWNVDFTGIYPPGGCGTCHQSYKNSGHEQKYEGLLGAALPVGPGRMGMFFQYAGKRGKFDGDTYSDTFGPTLYNNNLKSDLDSFILRLLYGLPMGAFKLGGEVQVAYRSEKNKTTSEYLNGLPGYWEIDKNDIFQTILPVYNNLLYFMFPYDSQYWEANFKGSLEGTVGPARIAFTMRGGFIFAGDNKLETEYLEPAYNEYGKLDGKVKGWNLGGDLWVRYPLREGLSIPFLVRVGYQQKTRNGNGPYYDDGSFDYIEDYKSVEKSFNVEVGGGVDKEFIKGTRVAAGIYYNYLNNKNSISVDEFDVGGGTGNTFWDNIKYPDQTEHRIILRLLGEKELSPMVALRMGFNFFYGWVKECYKDSGIFWWGPPYIEKASLNGNRWGVGASLGGTVKFQQISLEPFLGGGYQQLRLSGDGSNPDYPLAYDLSKKKNEWYIGGGLSIKFNR
jgi:hypothetical protein